MEYRLNKFISNSGYCSRRQADKYIESGNVTIDGKRAKLGDRVLPGQKILVNGHLLQHDIEPVYIVLNKPAGIVCTNERSNPDNILDFVAHEHRIFPIGMIDRDTQGLVLLTNDGNIANKVIQYADICEKEYIVTVDRAFDDDFLVQMGSGVPILDRTTKKCKVERIDNYTFRIVITQALNRQIRRMCEYFSYNVIKLERVRFLNVSLSKLGLGNWRNLTHAELNGLFDLLEKAENIGIKASKKIKHSSHPTGYGKKARREEEKKQPRASNKRIGKQRPEKAMRRMKQGKK